MTGVIVRREETHREKHRAEDHVRMETETEKK